MDFSVFSLSKLALKVRPKQTESGDKAGPLVSGQPAGTGQWSYSIHHIKTSKCSIITQPIRIHRFKAYHDKLCTSQSPAVEREIPSASQTSFQHARLAGISLWGGHHCHKIISSWKVGRPALL